MTTTYREYYIASVLCHEMRGYTTEVLTQDDTLVWLSESENYPTTTYEKSWAKRFDSIGAVILAVKKTDGKPWYHKFKKDSLRVYKMTETITTIYTEELVD